MMNQRILDALEQIDEKYIEEAAPAPEPASPKKFTATWMKWLSVAACAAIVVFTGVSWITHPSDNSGGCNTEQTPVITDNLPLLTSYFESDGMGFEGLMFYDISGSGNGNPWTEETELSTLPVYRNLAYVDSSGIPICLSDEEMLRLAKRTTTALGSIFDISDISIETTEFHRHNIEQNTMDTDTLASGAASLTATIKLGTIRVDGNGLISVNFSEPISLPKENGFTYGDTTDEEALKSLKYLTQYFSDLTQISTPLYDTHGDYSFAGEQHRIYRLYEGNGTTEEQILYYHFAPVFFYPNEEGTLWMIRFGNILNCTEKIGDYPLITADTAQKLLLANQYITSVPSEYLENGEIQKEHIAKVELVYRTGNINEVFMPYYRFYVELTEFDSEMAAGLKNYGAYYVPAVSGEYLSDFPMWDGSSN